MTLYFLVIRIIINYGYLPKNCIRYTIRLQSVRINFCRMLVPWSKLNEFVAINEKKTSADNFIRIFSCYLNRF